MKLYEVPIIQPDLRHEETIIQTANAFEYLNNVINDVFDKIDARINVNNKKINALNSRIAIANSKVESLIGIKKAINVYSPAKYPADGIFQNFTTTFTPDYKPNFTLKEDYHVKSNLDPITNKNIQEKLQFYHVKQQDESEIRLNEIMNISQGLGPLPTNPISVDSFLLYNTMENPYKNYKSIDPLDGTKISSRVKGTTKDRIEVEAAPSSIANRKIGGKKMSDNFFYTPGLNEAPELDLPLDLPDLPGIADNIIFTQIENEPTIAPSIACLSVNHDLPALPEPQSLVMPSKIGEFEKSTLDKSKINGSKQLPPPPPIPAEINIGAPIQAAPPPPPPPPPPPASLPLLTPLLPQTDIPDNSMQIKSSETVKAPVVEGQAHSNLMEAIRAAGGVNRAKLKRPNQSKTLTNTNTADDIQEKKQIKQKPGGDLMADLHNKLLMRRKGISGAKDTVGNQQISGANVMDRVSAMIPPPPSTSSTKQRNQQQNSSTTEPSDEDDWD